MLKMLSLTPAERDLLTAFVARTEAGTAYRRRAQLLLLSDDGLPPEISANKVGVTITQTRALLRAFDRQRLALFPAAIFAVDEEE